MPLIEVANAASGGEGRPLTELSTLPDGDEEELAPVDVHRSAGAACLKETSSAKRAVRGAALAGEEGRLVWTAAERRARGTRMDRRFKSSSAGSASWAAAY